MIKDIPDYLKPELEALKLRLKEAGELYEKETDPELKKLAKEEVVGLKAQITQLSNPIRIPSGSNGASNSKGQVSNQPVAGAILEIRAGAGGNEAGLFAHELYRMYQKYSEGKGWKVKELSRNEGGIGNIKEIVAEIRGKEDRPYNTLKHESGIHRVQRVPVTESGGRIHTSTVSVAILPEVSAVEIEVNPKDLKIDTFRSSGKGGQNVNKLETAVRITHVPTGTVVECQEERSQQQNKTRALAVLRSRLYEEKRLKDLEKRGKERKEQVGTMDRSEKIRTYNFPQNRITDHRVKKSWGNVKDVLDGNLDKIILTLQTSANPKS